MEDKTPSRMRIARKLLTTTTAHSSDEVTEVETNLAQEKPLISTSGVEVSTSQIGTIDDRSSSSGNGKSTEQRSVSGVSQAWKMEIFCSWVAVATIIAMWRTLHPYQYEAPPTWPLGISINTAIAIYVLILKACMSVILSAGIGQLKWNWFGQTRPLRDIEKFDEATRGPVGAFKLLWTVKGRNPIAALAALIVMIAIAIDPFSQQVVHFETGTRYSDMRNATIARTNMYDPEANGVRIGDGSTAIPQGLESAINSGLLNPGTTLFPWTCPSFNCTYFYFASFGYCSKCTDISEHVNITKSDGSTRYSNFTLPSGLLSSPSIQKTFSMAPDNSTSYTYQALLGMQDEIGKDTLGNLSCTGDQRDLPWACRGYGAAQCRIYPCIKSYNSIVQNGALRESTLHESTDEDFGTDAEHGGGLLSMIDFFCLSSTEKELLRGYGYPINDTSDSDTQNFPLLGYYLPYNLSSVPGLYINQSILNNKPLTLSSINPDCIYQYTTSIRLGLPEALDPFLTGSLFAVPGKTFNASTIAMEAFFSSGNVSTSSLSKQFSHITNSMTAFIRQHGSPNHSKPGSGHVWEHYTIVVIEWKWLSFPILLTCLTWLFFVAMVLKTRTRDALVSGSHNYKSAALPLVFHGLEARMAERFGMEKGGRREMVVEAARMRVRLGPTERGWKFVEVGRDGDGDVVR